MKKTKHHQTNKYLFALWDCIIFILCPVRLDYQTMPYGTVWYGNGPPCTVVWEWTTPYRVIWEWTTLHSGMGMDHPAQWYGNGPPILCGMGMDCPILCGMRMDNPALWYGNDCPVLCGMGMDCPVLWYGNGPPCTVWYGNGPPRTVVWEWTTPYCVV